MTEEIPIPEESTKNDDDDPFDRFRKQRTKEALALQEQGVVSNSGEIKKKLIDLLTRKSTCEREHKFYESIPSSVSELGSNVNVERIEYICQNIAERMQTIEGDIAIVKTSLFKPPEIMKPPPPPPPPPLAAPEKEIEKSAPKKRRSSRPRLFKSSSSTTMNLRQRERVAKNSYEKR